MQRGKSIYLDKTTCDHCPRQSDYPAKRTKRNILLHYDAKLLRPARWRAHEKTEDFREVYRYRAGGEATMSALDRCPGLKHLRVRGMRQVHLAATLKGRRIESAAGHSVPKPASPAEELAKRAKFSKKSAYFNHQRTI